MATRIRVFDRLGWPMAEIDATADRVLLLNEPGELEFSLAMTDRKARPELLRFGTYILVEHDKLPAWVGVIDPPQDWSGDRSITVSAYEAPYLLSWRLSDSDEPQKGTAGQIWRRIIYLANRDEDLLLRNGDIYGGGPQFEQVLEGQNLLEDAKSFAERSRNDFSIEPAFDASGRLYLSANWHYQRGVYRPDITLREGVNLELPTGSLYRQQGNLVNRIIGEGQGAKKSGRITYTQTQAASRSLYRLRIARRSYEAEDDGALRTSVQADLAQTENPEEVFSLFLLDVGNAYSIRMGDIVALQIYTAGFAPGGGFGVQTYVRVVGMRIEDEAGRVELFVKGAQGL